MSTAAIVYEGITLEVEYDYNRAYDGGREEPSYPAYIEVNAVLHKGEDISILLAYPSDEEIERLVWEHIAAEREAAECDHADYLRDKMRLAA